MTTKPTQNRKNNFEEKAYNAPTGIFAFARSVKRKRQVNRAPNPLNNDKPNPQSQQSSATSKLPKNLNH